MKVSWPILPLLGILLAICTLVLGAALLALPNSAFDQFAATDRTLAAEPVPDGSLVGLTSSPQSGAQSLVDDLLGSSPFSPTRSAFRSANEVSAQTVTYEPEFVGFLGREPSRRVMIMWETGDLPITHELGAETPWGILVEVKEDRLVFRDGETERALDLFAQ
jgi:hypothetical protein